MLHLLRGSAPVTLWLLLLALAQDPKCESRKPGLAAPECTTYATVLDAGKPTLTCRAACYTQHKPKRRDGGIEPSDTHVVRDEVPGPDTPAARAECRRKLEEQAKNGCKRGR